MGDVGRDPLLRREPLLHPCREVVDGVGQAGHLVATAHAARDPSAEVTVADGLGRAFGPAQPSAHRAGREEGGERAGQGQGEHSEHEVAVNPAEHVEARCPTRLGHEDSCTLDGHTGPGQTRGLVEVGDEFAVPAASEHLGGRVGIIEDGGQRGDA